MRVPNLTPEFRDWLVRLVGRPIPCLNHRFEKTGLFHTDPDSLVTVHYMECACGASVLIDF